MGTNKTNDLERIKKETGMEVGNVYIRKKVNVPGDFLIDEVERYSGIEIYDTRSCNFHIFPESIELRQSLANTYKNKRTQLAEMVKAFFIKHNSYKSISQYKEIAGTNNPSGNSDYDSSTLYFIKGVGSRGGNKDLAGIYKYLGFYFNSAWYRINFMRFFYDEERKVHCCMNHLQYDRDKSYNGYGLNKGNCGFEICYPVSCKDRETGHNSIGNIAYNPNDADYYSESLEDIVKSFLDFVERYKG